MPTIKVIKRLFACCSNRCAFPGCEVPIVEDSGIVTGQVAHICASSRGGAKV